MSRPEWSVALRCADLGNLADGLRAFEDAGCNEIHFDVRDGAFAPGFGLGFEVLAAAKAASKLPCAAHLMVTRPERYVEAFAEAGCAGLTVHVEATLHAPRTLDLIRELGMAPGIAVNPATPLTKLEYLFPHVDRVLLLAQEPGAELHQTPGGAFERVKILRESLDYHERGVKLQVEGACGSADTARLIEIGGDIVVLDAPELFATDDLAGRLAAFMEEVAEARSVV